MYQRTPLQMAAILCATLPLPPHIHARACQAASNMGS